MRGTTTRATRRRWMSGSRRQPPCATDPRAISVRADGRRTEFAGGVHAMTEQIAQLLPALAARRLAIRCTATSPATEAAARALGLFVEPLEEPGRLEIAIDGADQIAPRRLAREGRRLGA